MSPDYPDHHSGVGLLASHIILGSPLSGQVIAPGATVTAFSGQITGASYNTFLDTYNANFATSMAPFTKVTMEWKDASGGNTIGRQHWFALQTNVAPAVDNALVCGKGPSDGDWLTILIKNCDPLNSVTVDFELLQTGRTITRHDWRNVSDNVLGAGNFLTLAGASTPVSDPAASILGTSPSIGILSLATTARINALFAGQCQLSVDVTPGDNINVQLVVFDPEFANPNVVIYTDNGVSAPINAIDLTLPRLPVIIVFANAGGSTAFVSYTLTCQEFAS